MFYDLFFQVKRRWRNSSLDLYYYLLRVDPLLLPLPDEDLDEPELPEELNEPEELCEPEELNEPEDLEPPDL